VRRAGAVLVTAALALAMLAGCTTASPSLDLADVLSADDAPARMAWVASGRHLTAADDLASLTHEWEESAGEPEECFPLYLVPYGIAPDDGSSADRTTEVGYLTHDEYAGSILVNAREFATDQAATDYLQHVLEAAGECPGYTIGDQRVGPDGFAVARFSGGHGLSVDGGQVADGVSSRTAVVRAGRTVLVVDAFLVDAEVFDPEVVDALARTMLDRLDVADAR
jgi:hypothetical protein